MRTLSSQFNNERQQFTDALHKIDREISQLGKQHPSSITQSDLNSLEHDQMPVCVQKLDTCENSILPQIVDLNRNYLILNGYPDFELSADDDLCLKLAQMRSNLNSCETNLSELMANVNQHRTIDQLYANLREFMANRSESLDNSARLSADLRKLEVDRRAHDRFIGDLIEKGDDVKKLMEYFAEVEEMDSGADLEAKWNQLCSKSDARKEKLFICFSMAEQFERVYGDLGTFLENMDAKISSDLSTQGYNHLV